MAIEVTVLELDARPLRRFCDEPDVDLAGVAPVRLELSPRTDVPTKDDPIEWFVREDLVRARSSKRRSVT